MQYITILLLCSVTLCAADSGTPRPLHGVRLGMDRKACMAALQLDAKGYGDGRGTYAKVHEGSWLQVADVFAPEVRGFLRNHGYSPSDILCLQRMEDGSEYCCPAVLWVLMNGDHCDRLLYVVKQRTDESLDDLQRRVEVDLGVVLPPMDASRPLGVMSAGVGHASWKAQAWRLGTADASRLVVVVESSTARAVLSVEELQRLDVQRRERLTIKPSDEALLQRMRMPVESAPPPTFRSDVMTPEAYATRAQELRDVSGFEKHVANGRGAVAVQIMRVDREGQGAKLGLRRLDSIISIDGQAVTDGELYKKYRIPEAPEQVLDVLAVDGTLRKVRVGPGKIGIETTPFGVNWPPVDHVRTGARGPWDADAITALLANDIDLAVTEQALAKALALGWQGPLADQVAGSVLGSRGLWREMIVCMARAEAVYAKQSYIPGLMTTQNAIVGAMSAAGWTVDAVPFGARSYTMVTSDALSLYLAALHKLPAGDAQRDLSRSGLIMEPRYLLRSYVRPLERSGLDAGLARRLSDLGKSELLPSRGFRTTAWDGITERCEVEFIFEPAQAYVWSINSVSRPELRVGLAHVRDHGRLESTQLFGNFIISSNGQVHAERRDVGSSFRVPSSFRFDGKPHHFRFVRWGPRVRLEINGISAGETMVDTTRLGIAPRLVLWMETSDPAVRGEIRGFSIIGFGEAPALPMGSEMPAGSGGSDPAVRAEARSDF